MINIKKNHSLNILQRKEEKRPRYLLNFNFFSGFNNHSMDEEILPEFK